MNPGRLARMLRHLRLSQLAHRLWYRLRLPWFAGGIHDRRLGQDDAAPRVVPPVAWTAAPAEGRRIVQGRIRLVGLEGAADGWSDMAQPLLWRFTLHYFEWLPHLVVLGNEGRGVAQRAVLDWLERFERFDPVAWHPYPLSLRLFAWLAHSGWLTEGADPAFAGRFRRALHRQARHLERVWERDVGGNHLIKNLKAAIACALCLPGHESGLVPALRGLEREVHRQILDDGCHYERSPSYHVQVLTDLEELCALFVAAGRDIPAFLAGAVERMRPAAAFFVMAPGALAQFNDGTADGPDMEGCAPVAALPQAGYWRLEAGPARLVVDCGPCCPNDLPAHAHADTLSFELYDAGWPLVVNCGTYAYQDARWRNRFRGTAFQSTLTVDDGDSAEVFGVFRLGRRPRRFQGSVAGGRFTGEFDGWDHLGVCHGRWLDLDEGGLTGEDRVTRLRPGPARRLVVRFHLHPAVTARVEGDGAVRLEVAGGAWRFTVQGGTSGLEPSRYSPRFHEMVASHCIRVDAVLEESEAVIAWCFERA